MTSTSPAQNPQESEAPGASDAAVFAHLEKIHGDGLKAVLARYLETSDTLCQRFQDAVECAFWQEAVRVALKIGEEADTLGFHRLATAARRLADATYHADSAPVLRNNAQLVVFEYGRFRLALAARYPEFIATVAASIA